MKITYIANARLPTHKAHGLQIAKTCEALVHAGVKLTLVLPRRRNSITASITKHYHLTSPINSKKIWCLDYLQIHPHLFFYYLQSLTFYFSVFVYLLKHQSLTIYTRDWPTALFVPSLKNHRLAVELHQLPTTLIGRGLLRLALFRSTHIVTTNPLLSQDTQILTKKPIHTIPNAVDPSNYQLQTSPKTLRKLLKLPSDKFLCVYTGSLQSWKGISTLIQAAAYLPSTTVLVVVGGTKPQLNSFIQDAKPKNLIHIPYQPTNKIAKFQLAADALIIPNSQNLSFSSRYTSPIKLFEYFAAAKPIIASQVPAITQFAGSKVLYFEPDNPESLAKSITRLSSDKKLINKLSHYSKALSHKFTWKSRAQKITKLLS